MTEFIQYEENMVTSCSYIPSEIEKSEATVDSTELDDLLSGSKMDIFPT